MSMRAITGLSGLSGLVGAAFAPDQVTGLTLWLKADAIAGLSDGDPVGTWSDSSGQGNHATQATAAKKPTYKTNIINGLPAVRFDGVDDYLQASIPDLRNGLAFLVVKHLSGGEAAYDSYFALAGAGNGNVLAHVSSSGGRGLGVTQPTLNLANNATDNGTSFFLVKYLCTGNAFTLSAIRGGGGSASGTLSVTTGTVNNLVLCTQKDGTEAEFGRINADVAELLFYADGVSSGDADRVRDYLLTKYAL